MSLAVKQQLTLMALVAQSPESSCAHSARKELREWHKSPGHHANRYRTDAWARHARSCHRRSFESAVARPRWLTTALVILGPDRANIDVLMASQECSVAYTSRSLEYFVVCTSSFSKQDVRRSRYDTIHHWHFRQDPEMNFKKAFATDPDIFASTEDHAQPVMRLCIQRRQTDHVRVCSQSA